MERIFLIMSFFAGFLFLNAQQTTVNPNKDFKNDIMIDPVMLIAYPLINFSYERHLNKDSGIGINTMILLGDEDYDFSQVSLYYRYYFGKKHASGFFIEGFVPITYTKDFYSNSYYFNNYWHTNNREEKSTTVGLGVAFGGKWVVKKNIVFELSSGIARRFGETQDNSNITGKGMLGIGYRF